MGLSSAATGKGYKPSQGLPIFKTKDPLIIRMLPVLDVLGMDKPWFATFEHGHYHPSDKSARWSFVCPVKTKQGDFCPSCLVHGPLEQKALQKAEEQGKEAAKVESELARHFRHKWKAFIPSINRKDNMFGWFPASGGFVGTLESIVERQFGSKTEGMNRILDPMEGHDIDISHPPTQKTAWQIIIDKSLKTPLFYEQGGPLQKSVDAWVDDLIADYNAPNVKDKKVHTLHRKLRPEAEMVRYVAETCARYGIPVPAEISQRPQAQVPVSYGTATPQEAPTANVAAIEAPADFDPELAGFLGEGEVKF